MTVNLFTKLMALVCPDGGPHLPEDHRVWGAEVEGALNALFAFGPPMYNGKLVATVNANVLTIAVKTAAGNDPSTSDPVYVGFRAQTAAGGEFNIREISAALSLAVSAGSTLGTSTSTPFRLWVTIFDDNGTLRLGVVNCLSIASGVATIFHLDEAALLSSTAEGGAGAADSALVLYTGTAVTTKPFRILGFLTWNSGLGTAGLWSAAPDVIQPFGPGVRKPGDRVQKVIKATGAVATGTTTVPADDTIPQNTEGDEYITQAVTPRSAANLLRIRAHLHVAASAAVQAIAALFQDTTASALAATAQKVTAAGDAHELALYHAMLAATASATTFKVRAGPSTAATLTFNGSAGARLFGGVDLSELEIEEMMG